MAQKISRMKIAAYVADEIVKGAQIDALLAQVAALLVEERRTREVELVVRSIFEQLEERGVVLAEVTTATPIDETLRAHIKSLTGAKTLHIVETVDESVLGGIAVTTPTRHMDATIAHNIAQLRAQIVQ